MKKIICILILTLLLFTACTNEENKSVYNEILRNDIITVGVSTDSPPFGFIDTKTGKNEGFDIDIAKYIARDILGSDKKVRFISVTPNTRIEAVTSSQVDMVIATMSVTSQRLYFVDFSIPYYYAGQTAIVKKDSGIKSFSDLKKKTSIIVLGTTAEQNLRKIVPTAKVVGFKNYDEAFAALLEGKGDALITDDTILIPFLYNHKEYKMIKGKISQEPYAIALKKEENPKLKQSIDVTISRLNKDGTIKNLKKKWKL